MVIAIIALLVSILLPVLSTAREKAESAYCVNNMKQLGIAISNYAVDNKGYYPYSNSDARFAHGGQVTWDDLISGYDGRAPLDPDGGRGDYAGSMNSVLGYNEHGLQRLYLCPSFRNAENLYYGGLKAVPRSYSISRYDPNYVRFPSRFVGVSGFNEPGYKISGVDANRQSRTMDEVSHPSRAIVLSENQGGNMLGRWTPAAESPVGMRNRVISWTPPYYNIKGSHAGGRLDNYLMADGHVESMAWVETFTLKDGRFSVTSGSSLTTRWDAGIY